MTDIKSGVTRRDQLRPREQAYPGEGDERALLADWTSLHFDLAARDRGLTRAAASLYELEERSTPC